MIIDGKRIAEKIIRQAQGKLSNKSLRLNAVLVGENPELKKFVELKKKAAQEIRVDFKVYEFPENINNDQLKKEIDEIVETADGVIIELPLPKHLNTQDLLNLIPQQKDVDVLSQESQDDFYADKSRILPPAIETIKQIFQEYEINPKGKIAAVFGQGLLVGKSASHWLHMQGASVAAITEHTKEPEKISKEADIIVSGAGKPNLITEGMIKEGATVIDFGKDVDFEPVSKKAGLITPPVGGVGPIVVATVLKNLADLWI